ncbi:MAG: type II toxin-antitoxin system VapC family toxin [Acidobacteria bacterium]|nr:type II toxin-antitoxin system VapC family toxin [Acidobacteriota bacterium]
MTLVDTSVWVDHFRRTDPDLVARLNDDAVTSHPFVIGELALGSLARRAEVLELLHDLPAVALLPEEAVLAFVERHHLAATGIGWVDAHLLAAADAAEADVLTRDKRLRTQAARLGLAAR